MGIHNAFAWTPELDLILGTIPDMEFANRYGVTDNVPVRRRKTLGIPSYRSTRSPITIPCATCGESMERKARDLTRSRTLFCSTECAAAGQKRRDSDMLRYGPGWKNRRAEIRKRDKVCRSCGMTTEQNGEALQVHHLTPFRFGGMNSAANLVALCAGCHHRIEAITSQVLASIQIDVSLAASCLMITVDGSQRWSGSVVGADSLTPTT